MLVGTVDVSGIDERSAWRERYCTTAPTAQQIAEASNFVRSQWPAWHKDVHAILIRSFSHLLSVGIPFKRLKDLISSHKETVEGPKTQQTQSVWTRLCQEVSSLFESKKPNDDYLSEYNIMLRTLCEMGLALSSWDRVSSIYFKRMNIMIDGKVVKFTRPFVLSSRGLYVMPNPKGVSALPMKASDPILIRQKSPSCTGQDGSGIVFKVLSFHKKTGVLRPIYFLNPSPTSKVKNRDEGKLSPLSIMTELESFNASMRTSLARYTKEEQNKFLNAFHTILGTGITCRRLTFLLKNNDKMNGSIHPVMLHTLGLLGEALQQWDGTSCLYLKRVLSDGRNRYSHAFCVARINDKVLMYYIPNYCPYGVSYQSKKKHETHSKGAFKDIAPAFPLAENGKTLVRKKPIVLPRKGDEMTCVHKRALINDDNGCFVDEEESLKALHREAEEKHILDRQYWAPPYLFKCFSQNGKTHTITPLYLQQEYLKSETILENANVDKVVEIFSGAARGLAALHDLGRVHGDFKTMNLLYGDKPLLTDFGHMTWIGEKGLGGTCPSPEELMSFDQTSPGEEVEIVKFPAIDHFALGLSLVIFLCSLLQEFQHTPWEVLYAHLSKNSEINNLFKYHRLVSDKWQILCVYLCVNGITEEIKTLLSEDLKKTQLWKRSTPSEKAKLSQLLEIGYQLFDKDPQKRISCAAAAKQMQLLR